MASARSSSYFLLRPVSLWSARAHAQKSGIQCVKLREHTGEGAGGDLAVAEILEGWVPNEVAAHVTEQRASSGVDD